jgi:hypothetical protein
MVRRFVALASVLLCAGLTSYSRPAAQSGSLDSQLFAEMKWRILPSRTPFMWAS